MSAREAAFRRSRQLKRPLATALTVLCLQPVSGIQPKPEGHFLTNSELSNITAVACLEARQRNPRSRCVNESSMIRSVSGTSFSGKLNAGNYPDYQDSVCNSNGEFFCDPASIFTMEERHELTAELKRLRENNPVVCGHLLNDPVDPRHYQPFYLGVALATKWPAGMSDPDSLQQFGQIIAAEWNMDKLFIGHPQPFLRCPNTAVLILMPDINRAFLSSSSCEFICQDLGGPEVSMAALVALDHHGPAAAVRAAMREAYRVVSKRQVPPTPRREPGNLTLEGGLQAGGTARRDKSEAESNGVTSLVVQRILFGFALAALVISILLVVMVFLIAPGWIPTRRRRK